MVVANILAHSDMATVTAVKSFKEQAPSLIAVSRGALEMT
jgi:hypothetical protein